MPSVRCMSSRCRPTSRSSRSRSRTPRMTAPTLGTTHERSLSSSLLLACSVANITKTLTENVYEYVCMGVFKKHALMFSFQMATMILQGQDKLDREELDFFLKGNISLEDVPRPPPAPWIPESGWKDMLRLTKVGKPAKDTD